MTPSAPAPTQKETFDPQVFLRDHRIHVQHGSLFLSPTLVLHPAELDPAHETALRKKLAHVFSLNQPNYFDLREHQALGLNLGQLVPISLDATHSNLTQQIAAYNARATTHIDKGIEQTIAARQHPIEAAIRETLEQPKRDPVGWETLKNGMTLTLMLQEKMRQNGFVGPLKTYFAHLGTPDQILGDAQRYTGISPLQFREAAKNGIAAVGTLLGLDAPTMSTISALVNESQKHEFSGNVIKNFGYGREKSAPNTPLADVLATGLQAKIDEKIPKYRAMVKNHFTSPEPIRKEEEQVLAALKLVDPVQLESLYLQGYDLCYTPAERSDSIAFYPNIYGLHRRSSDNPRALTGGSPKIYFAGGNGLEKAHGTLVHEIAHNIFPDRFSREQVAAMEKLLAAGDAHISKLHHLLTDTTKEAGLTPLEQQHKLAEAYAAGNEQEKSAVAAEANKLLAPTGITCESLLPYLQKPETLDRLTTSVARAHMDLRIEGGRYLRSGYDEPAARVREMLSRFAELKQVVLRDTPEMLNFIAPQMNELFDHYYIPHLREVNAAIKQQHATPAPPLLTPPPKPDAAPATPNDAKDVSPAAETNEQSIANKTDTAAVAPVAPPPPEKPDVVTTPQHSTPVAPVVPPPHAVRPPIRVLTFNETLEEAKGKTLNPVATPTDKHQSPTVPTPKPAPLPTAVAASLADHSASCAGCAACSGQNASPSPVVTNLNAQGFAAARTLQELGTAPAI